MKCLKCNKELTTEDKQCLNCGFKNKITIETYNKKITEKILNSLNEKEPEETNEKKFINAYIGKKFQNIYYYQNFISGSYLIFGPAYLLYRKMYLSGTTLLILTNILIFLSITNKYSFIFIWINLLITLFLSTKIKKIYIKHCKKKINNIKNTSKNKTEEEILNILKKNGGTNKLLAIISLTITTIIIIFSYNKKLINQETEEIFFEKLHFQAPQYVELDNIEENEKGNTYEYYLNNLIIKFKTENQSSFNDKKYNNIEVLIKEKINKKITKETINNHKWYQIKEKGFNKYHYITKYEDKYYELFFKCPLIPNYKCQNTVKTITKTMKFRSL